MSDASKVENLLSGHPGAIPGKSEFRVVPCAICGDDVTVEIPPWENPATERIGKKMMALVTEDARIICDPCAEQWTRNHTRHERRNDIPEILSAAKAAGVLSGDPRLSATFATSKREYEDRNPSVWQQAREWNYESNLYLYGLHGAGKTWLCMCLLSKALDDGHSIAEVTAREFAELPPRFKETNDTKRALKHARVLLIDDIDKAPWWQKDCIGTLWDLLNARIKNPRHRTLFTANCDPNGLAELVRKYASAANDSYVPTFLDRMHPLTALEMTGDSLRRQA